jgi:transcriptional regulator with XRE-family HTH domain
MDTKNFGSSFDSLFEETGELDEMNERLAKRMFADRIRAAMKRRRMTVSDFARRMGTSPSAVRRLFDHTHPGASLASLVKATRAVGMAFDPQVIEAQKNATYLKKYGPNLREREQTKETLHARKYGRRG